MKKIPLSQGKYALIDDKDFLAVSRYKWHVIFNGNNWYARRHTKVSEGGRRKGQYLHRFLVGDWKMIDHRNGNTLDYRRCNLRDCTSKENARNRRKSRGISHYKGVILFRQKWCARIFVGGKNIHLGCFKEEKQAGEAYNSAARIHYGKFAWLNPV